LGCTAAELVHITKRERERERERERDNGCCFFVVVFFVVV